MKKMIFDQNFAEYEMNFADNHIFFQKQSETVLTIRTLFQGIFGLGEKFNCVNQINRIVVNKVIEKFCYQGELTYCPIPFFFTDTGLGVFADTDEETIFDFSNEEIRLHIPANTVLKIFLGTPAEIISEFVQETGDPVVPPEWVFGPWISANHWKGEADIEQQLKNLEQYDYPASVIVLEAWSDESTFYIFNEAEIIHNEEKPYYQYQDFDFSNSSQWSNPRAMIQKLHDMGIHLILWQIPVYKKLEDGLYNRQNALDESEALEKGYCVRRRDGSPYRIPKGHWFEGSLLPDFTNPEAEKSWFDKRKYLLEIGVDGFKTDGGEFIYTDDILLYDGTTGKEAKNRYAQCYVEAYTRFIGEERILFSRAGYIGAQKTPCLWAGDQQSDNSELKSVLCAGLSAGLSGIPFWGFDIAGFAGELPTIDLYRRATQMACFSPIMQWHSEPDGGQFQRDQTGITEKNNERSPWNMAFAWNDPAFIDEMRYWYQLRKELLPYIYEQAKKSAENRMPFMRHLIYDFPNDPNVLHIEDQYMFGDSLLVAPVTAMNAKTRSVYLPEGDWTDYYTGDQLHGGQKIIVECSTRIPVFKKV